MTQEALKLALEGVEIHSPNSPEYIVCAALIEALRENAMREVQRLGQEIEQEPVAWEQFHEHMAGSFYTAPPRRTWVGLTDEEIDDLWESTASYYNTHDFARAIEAKLKEKNT